MMKFDDLIIGEYYLFNNYTCTLIEEYMGEDFDDDYDLVFRSVKIIKDNQSHPLKLNYSYNMDISELEFYTLYGRKRFEVEQQIEEWIDE